MRVIQIGYKKNNLTHLENQEKRQKLYSLNCVINL
jgi:hypothetical protein